MRCSHLTGTPHRQDPASAQWFAERIGTIERLYLPSILACPLWWTKAPSLAKDTRSVVPRFLVAYIPAEMTLGRCSIQTQVRLSIAIDMLCSWLSPAIRSAPLFLCISDTVLGMWMHRPDVCNALWICCWVWRHGSTWGTVRSCQLFLFLIEIQLLPPHCRRVASAPCKLVSCRLIPTRLGISPWHRGTQICFLFCVLHFGFSLHVYEVLCSSCSLVSFFLFPAFFLTLVSVNFFTGSSLRFGTMCGSALLRGCIGIALTVCFGMLAKKKMWAQWKRQNWPSHSLIRYDLPY